MALILILDLLVIVSLVGTAVAKGYEAVLPLAACLLLLFPLESQIRLAGLFDLTTQRVIVLTLFGLYLAVGRSQDDGSSEALPLRYPLIAMIVWLLLSSALSVVPLISIKATLSQYLDFCLLYLMYVRRVSRIETVHKVLTGFVTGTFICSLFALLEIFKGWSITSLFPTLQFRFSDLSGVDDRGLRVQSTFPHPILFGAALVMAVPIAIYLLTIARTQSQRLFLWIALALMLFCSYKTGSRGPWMALALSLGLLLVLGSGPTRKYVLALLALAALTFVLRPGIWATLANLYGETLDSDSAQGESYQWRYVLIRVARQQLSRDTGRCLWGYGPESFYYLGLTTQMVIDGEEHTVNVDTCDSAVVELLIETGCVGFLLVAVFLLAATAISLKRYFSSPDLHHSYHLVLFVNLCAFCFLMTNVELFGWGQQSHMLWVLIALAVCRPSIDTARSLTDEAAALRAVDYTLGARVWSASDASSPAR